VTPAARDTLRSPNRSEEAADFFHGIDGNKRGIQNYSGTW